jgi:hypothetical protein
VLADCRVWGLNDKRFCLEQNSPHCCEFLLNMHEKLYTFILTLPLISHLLSEMSSKFWLSASTTGGVNCQRHLNSQGAGKLHIVVCQQVSPRKLKSEKNQVSKYTTCLHHQKYIPPAYIIKNKYIITNSLPIQGPG